MKQLTFFLLLACLTIGMLPAQQSPETESREIPAEIDKQVMEEFNTVDNAHYTQEVIRELTTRNVLEMVSIMTTQVQVVGDDQLYLKGLPAQVYVDGVKVRGPIGLPQKAIKEMRVVSGPTEFR